MTLTAENLGKRFNREWIFRNFSYSFSQGVYAITGPNGSGKSTLLQVLWGQLPASSGTITWKNRDGIVEAEDLHREIMIATPYMELIEEFTLMETLRFHFSFKSIRGGLSLDDVVEKLELDKVQDRPVSQFSSGMKQRLKLGLAFFSEVPLVFLDEPTTNLDKKAVEWYWRNFNEILGKSIIFIGSNLENEYPADATRIHLPDMK